MSPRVVLAGGGEMGELARAFDWASTPLGTVAAWPQSLRTAASICLKSRFPMLLWWGPEKTQLYNDGYRVILGDKHPRSIGQAGDECWAEIWDVVGPLYEKVVETGTSTWSEDLLLHIERSGYLEETYFTFSYSPILDEAGGVGGVLVTVVETTDRVLSERRMRTLRDIAAAPSGGTDRRLACRVVAETLAAEYHDVPFSLIYLTQDGASTAMLAGASGVSRGDAGVQASVAADGAGGDASDPWGIGDALRSGESAVVPVPSGFSAPLRGGVAVEQAVVVPFATPSHDLAAGVLVAGVNPGRELDDDYHTFFRLIADQLATRVAAAEAYAAERERAEKLAALDRTKTTFFSNVSHEFRTPLTLLLGPLGELLEDHTSGLAEGDRERLTMALRNATRMLKLVNTLLDFTRLEGGRLRAVRRPVDLAQLTRSLAAVFQSAMESAGLEYRVGIDGPPDAVAVDPDLWEKIVLNLISNAFKYTPSGGVTVRQGVEEGRIVLEVEDTGVGVRAEDIPHLFERFFRARAPDARSQEGTGIGLALAKELAELHGGRISVESEPGRGTTFRVEIPREAAAGEDWEGGDAVAPSDMAAAFASEATSWLHSEADRVAGLAPGAGSALPADALGGPRGEAEPIAEGEARDPVADPPFVLVADDNADMRRYLGKLLAADYRVAFAIDGREALRLARERRPDLLLSDAMMPGLDGLELLDAVRGDDELAYMPVILLSARAGEEATIEGIEAGADDYVIKPFTARQLRARVHTTLALARARDEARRAERDARERAEEAVEARARFMANTSHELRTPLNAVMAYLELLLSETSGEVNEVQRSHLERIRAGATHLKQIIEEILTFARLEAGTENGALRELDLADPMREVADLIRPQFEAKGLQFTLEIPERREPFRTDAAKVRQILLNLLSNAHKYTEKGAVTMRMAQHRDGSVEVDVIDTGPGIPEPDRERVFEAFWRGPGSDAGGGTGLGLSVSRSLARLLGGDLTLTTSTAGSTFTLALPGP
ncbi:MAG TPA: ATP-binding protein [Longimicrobiales bacterium]|nr:ATP-binding protein [Longimicrobiales bacterium]